MIEFLVVGVLVAILLLGMLIFLVARRKPQQVEVVRAATAKAPATAPGYQYTTWRVRANCDASERMAQLLSEGWALVSVTKDGSLDTYHLTRKAP